jgi:hypothetical protein
MSNIIDSILAINPNAQVTVRGDNVNNIEWNNGTQPIPVDQILAKQQELIADYNSKQYQRNRASEYPDFRDYLDGIVKGDNAQVQKYINDCLAVKAKYPKGS